MANHPSRAVKSVASRVVTAVAAVAGVASLFYGLEDWREAYRWIWALVGVGLIVGAAPPIFKSSVRVFERYTDYPRVLELLGTASTDLHDANARIAQLESDLPDAFIAGVGEGRSTIVGIVQSQMGGGLTATHLDVLGGQMVVYATPVGDGHGDMKQGARYLLVTSTGRGIAVLEVESEVAPVMLRPTKWTDADSWSRLSDRAVAGDAVPPGLELRATSIEDYAQFDEPHYG